MTVEEWFEKNRGDPEFIEACKGFARNQEIITDEYVLKLAKQIDRLTDVLLRVIQDMHAQRMASDERRCELIDTLKGP